MLAGASHSLLRMLYSRETWFRHLSNAQYAFKVAFGIRGVCKYDHNFKKYSTHNDGIGQFKCKNNQYILAIFTCYKKLW